MRKEMRLVALLVLLALVVLLVLVAIRRRSVGLEDVEAEAAYVAVKVEDTVVHDDFAAVAFLAVGALFAFVLVTAVEATLRAINAEDAEDEVSTSGTAESVPSQGHGGP